MNYVSDLKVMSDVFNRVSVADVHGLAGPLYESAPTCHVLGAGGCKILKCMCLC